MVCQWCYLQTEEEGEEECPFCEVDKRRVVRGLWVPSNKKRPVSFVELPRDWAPRLAVIAAKLWACSHPVQRTELDADGRQVLVAYHSGCRRRRENPRLGGVGGVYGDAVVLLMDRRSGEEVSMPRDIQLNWEQRGAPPPPRRGAA